MWPLVLTVALKLRSVETVRCAIAHAAPTSKGSKLSARAICHIRE
jgi:hypothetical protein